MIHAYNKLVFLTACLLVAGYSTLPAQDGATEPKIDFEKTIKPILEARCTNCHNAEDEEGGLDLTDRERLMEYIEPGKPLESSLYDSLTGANDMEQMPPEEDNDGNPLAPCTNQEMALIYYWIQQGASFEGAQPVEKKEEAPKSAAYRIFLFTGYFHPAIVHFPIALITMSAVFIILFFRLESLSDDAAYYLLFFGTLAAVVACVMGWAFADRNPVSITNMDKGINWHRWSGIIATVVALITVIIGWRARSEIMQRNRSNGLWKFGVILTAVLMGLVGHQGGEEVYGEGMYDRAAKKLIPEYWPFKSDKKANGNQPAQDQAAETNKADDKTGQPADDEAGKNAKPDDSPDSDSSSDATTKENEPDASNDPDPDPKTNRDNSESENRDKDGPPVDPTVNKNN